MGEERLDLHPAVSALLSQLMQARGVDTLLITQDVVARPGRPVEVRYSPSRRVWCARLAAPAPRHLRLVEDS